MDMKGRDAGKKNLEGPASGRLGRRHQAGSEWREAPNLFCRRWDPPFRSILFFLTMPQYLRQLVAKRLRLCKVGEPACVVGQLLVKKRFKVVGFYQVL